MLEVGRSRLEFRQEMEAADAAARRRRRSEQLTHKALSRVPRCHSTGGGGGRLGGLRLAGAEDDDWLAASVAHVRELARKSTREPTPERSSSRRGESRRRRRRRRAEAGAADALLPMDRLHRTAEDDATERRRRWRDELQGTVREQRKTLSKMKVDRGEREQRLASLRAKLEAASAADARAGELLPQADTKLIVVRARLDDTVRETREMACYGSTLALLKERAKEQLHDEKARTERLQAALATLGDEVAETKQLLLTLEEARALAAKKQASTTKLLVDNARENGDRLLMLQDRVAGIDPDEGDEVEQQVQTLREHRRQERKARADAKASAANERAEKATVSAAMSAELRQRVEAAMERIRSATGVEDPLQFAAKFEKHTAVAAEWQEKAEAAKARIARLQEELKATKQAEQTAFLEYDQQRLTSRKKALRPRTSALAAAKTKLERRKERCQRQRVALIVSGEQIWGLVSRAHRHLSLGAGATDGDCPPEARGVQGLLHLQNILAALLDPAAPPADGGEAFLPSIGDDWSV